MIIHKHDAVIVGAGLASLYGALKTSDAADTAVLSKIFPTVHGLRKIILTTMV